MGTTNKVHSYPYVHMLRLSRDVLKLDLCLRVYVRLINYYYYNWAALTKETFAIYSSIKKLSYYVEDADIILRSDHLPLKKFLQKNTLNSKVNNWAVEISPYRSQFEYIKGIKNTLADTMSR